MKVIETEVHPLQVLLSNRWLESGVKLRNLQTKHVAVCTPPRGLYFVRPFPTFQHVRVLKLPGVGISENGLRDWLMEDAHSAGGESLQSPSTLL